MTSLPMALRSEAGDVLSPGSRRPHLLSRAAGSTLDGRRANGLVHAGNSSFHRSAGLLAKFSTTKPAVLAAGLDNN